MMEKEDFFRVITTTNSYSRFLSDCKDLLKGLIYDARYTSCGLPRETFYVYSEYIASGIIGVYRNWLKSKDTVSLEQLIDLMAEAVEIGWVKIMG